MKLVDFYNKALISVGMQSTEEGNIVYTNDESKLVTASKKQMVMPIKQQINIITEDKILFNPLQEDMIKGMNLSTAKVKVSADRMLANAFNLVIESLALLAKDIELQNKANLELNKFTGELNKLRKQNMKEIVDAPFVTMISKVHSESIKKTSMFGSIAIKIDKNKAIEGEKFSKVGSLILPIYEDLLLDSTKIYDIELKRKKDADIYKTMVEFIIGKNDNDEVALSNYTTGSNSLSSPSFIVIYRVYFKLATRLNKLIDGLKFINEDIVKAKINLALSLDDLSLIPEFDSELRMIPNLNKIQQMNMEPIRAKETLLPARDSILNRTTATADYRPSSAAALMNRLSGSNNNTVAPRETLVVNRPSNILANIRDIDDDSYRPMRRERTLGNIRDLR